MIKKDKNIFIKGLSLVEILVVVTIFAVLGVIVSASLVLTIQATKKSEAIMRVRENLNYSLGVIERNIRNASSISDCTNSNTSVLSFINQDGASESFSCINTGGANSYIKYGTSHLTPDSVSITSCSFTCAKDDLSKPAYITIDMTFKDASSSGTTAASVSTESQVYLRN